MGRFQVVRVAVRKFSNIVERKYSKYHHNTKLDLGQNRREAQRPMGPIVAPKQQASIGSWNERTMVEATRTAQVATEMAKYGFVVPRDK